MSTRIRLGGADIGEILDVEGTVHGRECFSDIVPLWVGEKGNKCAEQGMD
jgi:hypothetical protein